MPEEESHDPGDRRALVCGCCAVLLGLGLARFAYSPLIPAIINRHWFSPGATACFGASNFSGYLLGAIVARVLTRRWPISTVMRVMMLVSALTFFACVRPVSFWWYFIWRFIPGFTGGVLIVVGPVAAMQRVPNEKQGMAGGIIFAGIGLGIIISGTFVPLLLSVGLRAAWIGLGLLALAVTWVGWSGWPERGAALPSRSVASPRTNQQRRNLRSVYWTYTVCAVGLVPSMLFVVDYIARDLGKGLVAGSALWTLFGVGATCGPVFVGLLADRIGFKLALRGAMVIQACALAVMAATSSLAALAPATFIAGVFLPGIISLVSGRLHEIVPKHRDFTGWQAAWSTATIALAVGQAVSAFGYSYLLQLTGSHRLIFWIGSAAMIMAFLIETTTHQKDDDSK